MDKAQAIDKFWSLFDVPVYDENSVPTGDNSPDFPYITYSVATSNLDSPIPIYGNIWDRSTSWERASKKADDIAKLVGEHGFYCAEVDGGYLWITLGAPFAQRMSDENDDMIKRIYINLMIEFLTSY